MAMIVGLSMYVLCVNSCTLLLVIDVNLVVRLNNKSL